MAHLKRGIGSAQTKNVLHYMNIYVCPQSGPVRSGLQLRTQYQLQLLPSLLDQLCQLSPPWFGFVWIEDLVSNLWTCLCL